MAFEIPDSMDECVYFTRRKFLPDKGKAIAWVRRQRCEKCDKGTMSKPVNEKTGKFKVRSKEYACSECGATEDKIEHEAKLKAEIIYQCPFCGFEGEIETDFTRKSFYGKKAIVFNCKKCGEKLGITKKMNIPPKFSLKLQGKDVKDSEVVDDDDDDF